TISGCSCPAGSWAWWPTASTPQSTPAPPVASMITSAGPVSAKLTGIAPYFPASASRLGSLSTTNTCAAQHGAVRGHQPNRAGAEDRHCVPRLNLGQLGAVV